MSVQGRMLVHPDIKSENQPERATHFLDVPNMPWDATKFPGIKIKVLYTDDSGITTALFKLEPGAVVPLHEHTALEQTITLAAVASAQNWEHPLASCPTQPVPSCRRQLERKTNRSCQTSRRYAYHTWPR